MKTKNIALIVVLSSLVPTLNVLAQEVSSNPSAVYTTLFSDNFSTKKMNGKKWKIPTWRGKGDGTWNGLTQVRCSQNSGLPNIKSGAAQIAFETYNPIEGISFYGTDLILKKPFSTTSKGICVTFVARVKGPFPRGTVVGLFMYSYNKSTGLHDEIDFELLGNYPHQVQTNIYGAEPLGVGYPISYKLTSGSATTWHTYQIIWTRTSVSWYVDGKLLRIVTTESPIPTGPMYVHANFWAPASDWARAYDPSLQPVSSPKKNKEYFLLLDSVSVKALN